MLTEDVVVAVRSLARRPLAADDALALDVITELDGLASIGAEWDRLVFTSTRYRPQASHAYVASYLEHLRSPDTPWACIVARRRGALVGVLPFMAAARHLDGESLEADIVVAAGDEARVTSALLAALEEAAPGWIALRLGDLPESSPTVDQSGRAGGHPILLTPSGRASYLVLPATYDAYLATLPSHVRHNLRRQTRRLFEMPGAEVEHVAASEATEAHLDAYIAVEASGWKAREDGGNAIARRTALTAYYRATVSRLAGAGALSWALLRAEGRVIAAMLMERVGDRLVLEKISYDESFSRVAPGSVLVGLVLERAIRSGEITEVDFVTDQPWHRRWATQTRLLYDVGIYGRSLRALMPWYVVGVARRARRGAPVPEAQIEVKNQRDASK